MKQNIEGTVRLDIRRVGKLTLNDVPGDAKSDEVKNFIMFAALVQPHLFVWEEMKLVADAGFAKVFDQPVKPAQTVKKIEPLPPQVPTEKIPEPGKVETKPSFTLGNDTIHKIVRLLFQKPGLTYREICKELDDGSPMSSYKIRAAMCAFSNLFENRTVEANGARVATFFLVEPLLDFMRKEQKVETPTVSVSVKASISEIRLPKAGTLTRRVLEYIAFNPRATATDAMYGLFGERANSVAVVISDLLNQKLITRSGVPGKLPGSVVWGHTAPHDVIAALNVAGVTKAPDPVKIKNVESKVRNPAPIFPKKTDKLPAESTAMRDLLCYISEHPKSSVRDIGNANRAMRTNTIAAMVHTLKNRGLLRMEKAPSKYLAGREVSLYSVTPEVAKAIKSST